MLKLTVSAVAALLALGMIPDPAHAIQPSRVFVAAQGADSNPCTFAAPCRTFQHAHDVVAAGGEIDVLDPAGYGSVTITKSISIQGHNFSGISVISGVSAITINASVSDTINLRGLLIDGTGGGNTGLLVNSVGILDVQDTLIRAFINGIEFANSAAAQLHLSNTRLSDNGLQGMLFDGSSFVQADIDQVTAVANGHYGLRIAAPGSLVSVNGGVFCGNGNGGVSAISTGSAINVMISGAVACNNPGFGVLADGAAATLRLTRTKISGNNTGIGTANGGHVLSYSDNSVDDSSSPTGTVSYK